MQAAPKTTRVSVAPLLVALLGFGLFSTTGNGLILAEDTDREHFFELHVRPLLTKHCLECHSAETEASGGLLLDSRANWELGGDSGDAIAIGSPDTSLLIKAIEYDEPDLQMPPDGKLPASAIAVLRRWIADGAVDPRTAAGGRAKSTALSVEQAQSHWAYRPVETIGLPQPEPGEASLSPIDSYVNAALRQAGIEPASEVNTAQLIRRLSFDLNGLPPTPEAIAEFQKDPQPEALERLVDRLLNSPRFGEVFARHWMDVARYAESVTLRGFVLPQAWRYRDYLIEAYNDDRPFDQMIIEQIAGDLLHADDLYERRKQLVATSFLAMGNTNLEEQDKTQLEMDYIDEQLEVLGRAFLGQTIGCARCHDHKFDPIPTRDYYALAGIFRNTVAMAHENVSKWIEQDLPVEPAEAERNQILKERLASVRDQIAKLKKRMKKGDDTAAPQSGKSVDRRTLPGIVLDDVEAKFVGEWSSSSGVASFVDLGYRFDGKGNQGEKSATFEPRGLPPGTYRVRLSYSAHANRATNAKVIVFSADGEKVLRLDQRQTPSIEGLWEDLGEYHFEANGQAFVLISNEDADGVVIVDACQFLAVNATAAAGNQAVASSVGSSGSESEEPLDPKLLQSLEKQAAELNAQLELAPRYLTVKESTPAKDIPIHIRGNVHNLGQVVPRGFLTAMTVPGNETVKLDEHSSGRLELARWIADRRHPLTARVYANRVWSWLIGQGLVGSTSNFGTTGDRPTHPELLDWLANELVRSGWSTKHLVRCIVLSQTYRRAVISPDAKAEQVDPNNHLLWRGNLRRVTVEALRDAMLFAGGELDTSMGGSSLKPNTKDDYNYAHEGRRRSIYHPVLRNSLPELFEVFDFADSSTSIGERSRSTVAPQALAMLNAPWVEQRSMALADLLERNCSTAQMAVESAFRLCLGRDPTAEESVDCCNFLLRGADGKLSTERLKQLARSLFGSLDFRYLE